MITKTTKIDDFTAEIERTATRVKVNQFTYDALVEQRLAVVAQQKNDNDQRVSELTEIDSYLQALVDVGVKSQKDNPNPTETGTETVTREK